jgi:hypothetical protein
MFSVLWAFANFVVDLFKSHHRLEAENLLLRHQLNLALRYAPRRLSLRGVDRAVLVGLVRFWPDLARSVRVVKPETVLRWHRTGFRAYWRWKSQKRAGRPKIDRDLRDLIRRMSQDNPLWGASRIHGKHSPGRRHRPIWFGTMIELMDVFSARVGAMGIRDRPISPRSPWQNGIAERLIGTLRRAITWSSGVPL